ncbi:unnamed protein product [Merluccius merluccius]
MGSTRHKHPPHHTPPQKWSHIRPQVCNRSSLDEVHNRLTQGGFGYVVRILNAIDHNDDALQFNSPASLSAFREPRLLASRNRGRLLAVYWRFNGSDINSA